MRDFNFTTAATALAHGITARALRDAADFHARFDNRRSRAAVKHYRAAAKAVDAANGVAQPAANQNDKGTSAQVSA